MSTDLGLFIIDNCFDLLLEDGDLKGDGGLETAVAISLFTDGRARDEELIYGHRAKRGWWGDGISEIDQDQIGSKIWLIERGKRNLEDLTKLQEYANLSLKWMLEDGVAAAVEVTGELLDDGQTQLNVNITRPTDVETRFSVLWDAQEIRRL